MRADEVQLGDNVWEHQVVTEIDKTDGSMVVFNGSHGWSARSSEQVMVTNRPTLRMKDWNDKDRNDRASFLRVLGSGRGEPITPYQAAWLRELALEIDNS